MLTVLLTGIAVAGTVLYILIMVFVGRVLGFNQTGHNPE